MLGTGPKRCLVGLQKDGPNMDLLGSTRLSDMLSVEKQGVASFRSMKTVHGHSDPGDCGHLVIGLMHPVARGRAAQIEGGGGGGYLPGRRVIAGSNTPQLHHPMLTVVAGGRPCGPRRHTVEPCENSGSTQNQDSIQKPNPNVPNFITTANINCKQPWTNRPRRSQCEMPSMHNMNNKECTYLAPLALSPNVGTRP